MSKFRVFLHEGYEDFDSDLYLYKNNDDDLIVAKGRYDNYKTVAQFPSINWLYYRLIEDKPSKEPQQYLIYLKNDIHDSEWLIVKASDLDTSNDKVTYTSEYGSKCDIENWAVVFRFNEHGYSVVDINDGVDSDTIVKACERVNSHVIIEIDKVGGMSE